MAIVQQVAFIITLGIAGFFMRKRVLRIRANILLGKKNEINDHKEQRLKNMLLVALVSGKCLNEPFLPCCISLFMPAF